MVGIRIAGGIIMVRSVVVGAVSSGTPKGLKDAGSRRIKGGTRSWDIQLSEPVSPVSESNTFRAS